MLSPVPSELPHHPDPGLAELFVGFLSIAAVAFGGVLPIARRALVERYRWLTPDEFTEVLGLAQFLPGPNIINLSVVVGSRFRGIPGAIAASLGLTLAPAVGVVTAGILFSHYADIAAVSNALAGLAAAAAGMVIGMSARMAEPLWRRPRIHATFIALASFVAIALLQISLPLVILVLGPLSVALSWWADRRRRR